MPISCDRAFELDSDSGTNCGYERKNTIGCLSFRMQHPASLVVLLVVICSLSRGWASENSEPPGEHSPLILVLYMGEGLLLDGIRLRMFVSASVWCSHLNATAWTLSHA